MTFSYGRVEVLVALINYTTLIVIGLYLLYVTALRFFDPQRFEGWLISSTTPIRAVLTSAV